MKIVGGGHVLAPEPLGARDLVVAGERIVAVAAPGVEIAGLEVEVRDLRGFTVTPGFIDNHVHVLGGGGGLGFASRAPELQTSQLTRAGVTSVIGMLGFDATSKDMRALIAKTKAFREDGVSAWALTGATLSVRLNEIRPEILAKGICRARISAGPFAAGSNSAGSGALRPFKILVARPGAGPAPIDEFRDQPTASSPRPSGAGCSASSQRPLPTPVGACNPRWRAMGETQAAQPLECPYTLEQVLGDWLTRRRPPSQVSAPATVSCAGRLRLARFRRLSGRIGEHGS